MSTIRFSQIAFATKSWVTEAWEKMVVELFSGRVVAEIKQLSEVCKSKWEVELRRFQGEVHSLCHHAIRQLLPIAGSCQQALLDDIAQAYTIYTPREAGPTFNRGSQAIEDTKGHVSGIRYNACKMRKTNRKVNGLGDIYAKTVMCHNSVKPYMDTLRFHIDQPKHILHIA